MNVTDSERQRRWPVLLSHRAQLLRIAQARTNNPADAEDCVQEALARAVDYPGLDLARAGAFLTTTTIRLTVDLHRTQARQARLLARVQGQAPVTSDHVEDVADRSLARWLAAEAEGLSPQERAVLYNRVTGGSSREAASSLGISVRAAESSLTRVRSKLQTAWARVAAVFAAAVVTWRRHVFVTLPLTAVAAAASLGPMVLLPTTGVVRPAPTQQQPNVEAKAPALTRYSAVAAHPIARVVGRPAVTHHPRPVQAAPETPWRWGWPPPPKDDNCHSDDCRPPSSLPALFNGVKDVLDPDHAVAR